ncbi:FAD-dependent monooxygenase [Sphingomonas sp. RT2P30]|uniref:FAD-dependent monooxygenase n=1 Tax=Parasphingomonas halimpatiens TaxID=3096162 RepID=UPI002FC93529
MNAAIALARQGVKVDLIELAEQPLGASLAFAGRAAETLVELGIYDEVHATGTPFGPDSTAASMHDATGRMVSAGPKRPTWEGAVDAVAVYRPVFLDVAGREAGRLGVRIRKGVTHQTIDDGEDAVTVTFTDGETGRYDLLVAADGISSKIRGLIFPEAPKPQFSGQLSIRWMAPGPPIEGEGWYLSPVGRLGFYRLPQNFVYVPAVIAMPEWRWLTDDDVRTIFLDLLDSMTAPAIRELRSRVTDESEFIGRPFEWIMVPGSWFKGRVLLIGDAAHATSAHMGMGGGMALEDAVVLGQTIGAAATLPAALDAFMARRFERVKLVVETSVKLGQLEQQGAPPSENMALLTKAFAMLGEPY